jgi:hypothetical protein
VDHDLGDSDIENALGALIGHDLVFR